ETHQRYEQQACIQGFRAIGLHEAAELGIVGLGAYVGVDGVGNLAPMRGRPLVAELLNKFHGAVESDPDHDLGMGEMLARPAYFPQAFVGLAPDALEMG